MGNFIKEKEYIATRETKDGRRIMVVGLLRQGTLKRHFKVFETFTTRGGEEILGMEEVATMPVNPYQGGRSIQKELFLGWSISDSIDSKDNYNEEVGKQLAYNRFGKPLETFNFTFLNEDMVNAIIENELNYIESNIDKYINRKERYNNRMAIKKAKLENAGKNKHLNIDEK